MFHIDARPGRLSGSALLRWKTGRNRKLLRFCYNYCIYLRLCKTGRNFAVLKGLPKTINQLFIKMNNFFSKFTPKEPKFFPLLKQLSEILEQASKELAESLKYSSAKERSEYYKTIKEYERQGDKLTHLIFDELGTTFITPFDREDIHDLASSIDDVIDGINSSAKRIAIYNPRPISDSGKELSAIIVEDARLICKAMDELESFRKKPATLREYCIKLHDLENQGDDIYEHFIIKLFEEEKDGIEIIKIKEIMQELEKTTDAAERVGKVLKNLIVKYA